MNNKDLLLSKKLIATYKERLEKEIIKKSNKLRIPQNISESIITNNYEITELQKAIDHIEEKALPSQQTEE